MFRFWFLRSCARRPNNTRTTTCTISSMNEWNKGGLDWGNRESIKRVNILAFLWIFLFFRREELEINVDISMTKQPQRKPNIQGFIGVATIWMNRIFAFIIYSSHLLLKHTAHKWRGIGNRRYFYWKNGANVASVLLVMHNLLGFGRRQAKYWLRASGIV